MRAVHAVVATCLVVVAAVAVAPGAAEPERRSRKLSQHVEVSFGPYLSVLLVHAPRCQRPVCEPSPLPRTEPDCHCRGHYRLGKNRRGQM